MDANVDFVIITALEEERDAVLALLPENVKLDKDDQDVLTYYRASIPTRRTAGGTYDIVVTCLTQMGPLQAAAQTAWVASRWRPRGLLVVGIAGGLTAADVHLGDVLVADRVADYTVGKVEVVQGRSQRRVRWEVYPTDMSLFDSAKNLGADWVAGIQKPRPVPGVPSRHTGIVASGGDVVADPEFTRRFRDRWDKLIGVEMEGGGAATALHASYDRPRFLMIRAVSDLADPDKNARDTKLWRPYACAVAAAYALELLRSGPLPPRDPPPSGAGSRKRIAIALPRSNRDRDPRIVSVAPENAQTGVDVPPGLAGDTILIHRLAFEYLPDSVERHGWVCAADNRCKKEFESRSLTDTILGIYLFTEMAPATRLDYELPTLERQPTRVTFVVRNQPGFMVYVRLALASSHTGVARVGWLTIRSDAPLKPMPHGDGFHEWAVPVAARPIHDDWIAIEVDARQLVDETFARHGLTFAGVTGIRMRDRVHIASVSFCA